MLQRETARWRGAARARGDDHSPWSWKLEGASAEQHSSSIAPAANVTLAPSCAVNTGRKRGNNNNKKIATHCFSRRCQQPWRVAAKGYPPSQFREQNFNSPRLFISCRECGFKRSAPWAFLFRLAVLWFALLWVCVCQPACAVYGSCQCHHVPWINFFLHIFRTFSSETNITRF